MSDKLDPERVIKEIRNAIDADEDEEIEVTTPQFERQDGVEPGKPPLTHDALDRLKEAEKEELMELGLQKWSDENGLWLLPHEWHPHLPRDYVFLNIMDEKRTRADLPAKPDKRFGVLSIGIVPEFEKAQEADEQSRGGNL